MVFGERLHKQKPFQHSTKVEVFLKKKRGQLRKKLRVPSYLIKSYRIKTSVCVWNASSCLKFMTVTQLF